MNVVYDIETFPNFFSVCFYELDTKRYKEFIIYNEINDIEELRRYWSGVNWKIGFNNIRFDDILMRYIMEGGDMVSPATINEMAQRIINTQKNNESIYKDKWIQKYTKAYEGSIDLMKIHALHKIGVSLKQVGVVLLHPVLEDLPKDPLSDIQPDEVATIVKYGRNDVAITVKLFEYSLEEIKLRHSISNQYDVNVISESRTYIAKKILDKYYQEYTKSNISDFKDLRSYYKQIPLKDIVKPFKYVTKPLQELYETIMNTVIDSESKFSGTVKTKGMVHQLGLGGLHSKNKNDIYEEDDTYALLDVDFDSYYPKLMLKYGLYPKHLKPEFLKVLETLTNQRLKAKKEGDKVTADTLKISINSLFGLLGFDQYWLKDDRLMYSVTVNGQLLLLGLIEYLESLGDVTCIYSNTDGATFKVPKRMLHEVFRHVEIASENLGIGIEAVLYKKMIVKDVNNYLIVKDVDDIKTKGAFHYQQDITKGFRHPIIQKALFEYFVHDTPVKDTIDDETNIYTFCIAQRTGKQFTTWFRTVKGMTKLQKTNRYFVSNRSGSIVKIKEKDDGTLQENQAVAGENVYLLNNYNPNKSDDYFNALNKNYYVRETNKVINSFVENQLELF